MEVSEGTLWDGTTPIAVVERSPHDPQGWLVVFTVRLMTRDAARAVVAALGAAALGPVDVTDDLVRFEARASGWTGALRGSLRPPAPGATPGAADADPAAAIGALLPGTDVRRRGFGRRALILRATASDGLRMKVKVSEREDLVPELVASALDTALAIRRRFGRMASGVHTIVIDEGAGSFDDHATAGATQSGSGTFYLDTSLAFADSMMAQRQRMARRVGVSAVVAPPFSPIDGVVAHEYWHNLDTTVMATPAVYVELNRVLGEELGVDTYEHALRGGEKGAPAAWELARTRIAVEVSRYALVNMRESTAELFKLWWCSTPAAPPRPLVACFGALLDRFYPPA